MRAIVHSIHSQVIETILGLTPRPERILSLDSHLDVSLGGDLTVYPRELRPFAERTSVHATMCGVTGGMPAVRGGSRPRRSPAEVIVAIPERMLAKHASDVEQKLPPALRLPEVHESVASVAEFLRTTMGLEVYPSPPKRLNGLVSRMEAEGGWLLDVDVDYMREMQDECYTQIRNTAPGVLQSMSSVLRFIGDSRPPVVTISEVRVSAIRDPRSSFSRFIGAVRDEGYDVEEHGVYGTDAEVLRGISVCKEFYRRVSRRLAIVHAEALMRGELAQFEKEERRAAREFFRDKGYSA
ncbi:MAG: hypothetical protein OK441_05695 [Thaumarchaeota archaeon]|nr:hypothetical protein [Nitrososphaerota archaeon]